MTHDKIFTRQENNWSYRQMSEYAQAQFNIEFDVTQRIA